MQIIPAIDLKDNKCVRLSKGKDNTSITFNNKPEQQAKYFEKIGCKKLHIVDLDAAFGRPEVNLKSIINIRKSISIPIQLGGGIRSEADAVRYFDMGIENIIIGSMSINQPEAIKSLSRTYRKKIYVSLDLKGNKLMIKGWNQKSKLTINDVVKMYKDIEIKGYVATDIDNDGMLNGININFIKEILRTIKDNKENKKTIILAGGLTNYEDLYKVKKLNLENVEGIISGKSFYVGNIDLSKGQKILDSND